MYVFEAGLDSLLKGIHQYTTVFERELDSFKFHAQLLECWQQPSQMCIGLSLQNVQRFCNRTHRGGPLGQEREFCLIKPERERKRERDLAHHTGYIYQHFVAKHNLEEKHDLHSNIKSSADTPDRIFSCFLTNLEDPLNSHER